MPDQISGLETQAQTNYHHQLSLAQILETRGESDDERVALREQIAQLDPGEMLSTVETILRKYLVCDDHQFTILTLWSVYTWCFDKFPTAAYLHICSPDSQSGKTLCLELLHTLSKDPWMATGATQQTVIQILENHEFQLRVEEEEVEESDGDHEENPEERKEHYTTFLLDDCHHTFGPSERQPLLARLNSGSRRFTWYSVGSDWFRFFGPKVFAGNARLPRSLAERCIPIVLRRKKATEKVSRFDPLTPVIPLNLLAWIAIWCLDNSDTLTRLAQQAPLGMPDSLTPHQSDCAEPLLHIANHIGGPWPEKIRAAFNAIFGLGDWSESVQALYDVRSCFNAKDNPEYLLSRDLLPLLTSMDQRPWSGWTTRSGRKLGALLHPFGIASRRLNIGDDKGIKGYLIEDFKDAWERYLPGIAFDKQESSSPNAAASLVSAGQEDD